ncbi:MAG: type I-A CRISPR-associated protein Cas4/Csa1 [Firmicutes bacterium]|nr:type I-A CRISPR-associated protein Cas4/Csa1 [Bacillota bacterium]
MYFLSEEERKRLLKGLLPKSREIGVAEELRGWNWHQPPLEPAYDVRLALHEVAGRYCESGRDLFLKRVDGVKVRPNREMIEGAVLHETLARLLLKAKRLIYEKGVGAYEEIFALLRQGASDEVAWPKSGDAADDPPLSEEEKAELRRKIRIVNSFEIDRIVARLQEFLVKQPYIGEDSLVAQALPVVVEQKLDGSFLGMSPYLSADAFVFSEPMILDLKFGEPRPFHRLATTGYALVMEAMHEFPINLGCIIYAQFRGNRLQITKDFHMISDELRQWFIEQRDELMRMVYEEADPGKAGACYDTCPYQEVCN